MASLAKGKAPNPVTLRPYRTFSEVEQPASLFVFRIDKQANMALFEADGKRWVADAVGNIAAYLKEQLADLDPPNLYPTVKAIIDGMTDAGIWTDDNHKVIKKLSFVYGGLSEEKGHYRLEFDIEEV
ncbi:RusA family crossover junction endodeoxyribonuclease [Streptococcus pneumoniae]|uniref:hypothetical protein n=1 Tax=Streptococcus pneumoniae TaxID=1313 RepID=UPI001F1750C9|nr:hypothetical protein [Streptococcus pneumoniae]